MSRFTVIKILNTHALNKSVKSFRCRHTLAEKYLRFQYFSNVFKAQGRLYGDRLIIRGNCHFEKTG